VIVLVHTTENEKKAVEEVGLQGEPFAEKFIEF